MITHSNRGDGAQGAERPDRHPPRGPSRRGSRQLAGLSADAGARYLQVGGFSSLRPAPGAPRFVEGEIPEEFREEALEGEVTRALLVEDSPADLDWVFISELHTANLRRAGFG